ncbi:GtrA family protein [Yoonia litorea]|uniref:Putative flippase GtrA (Transmembrane translocase of bactoprenol-linked glucose) n=1 Tax=Yoonia litorea TaxID=1123755 RepID=A0A1I6MUY2_9RHOB|nr:GtrA family protein [Yoonia litorea]SFS19454.1 Putative flippase GtrA (transmembrane translocase of bactoprenol-linked glucose) [Yoonia litorea]
MADRLFQQIAKFGVVGALGFCVDGGLLWLFVENGIDPYLARAISFPCAVLVTWYCNRVWTFSASRADSHLRQLGSYFGVQVVGGLTNYVVYAFWIAVFGTDPANVMVGFALGSALGAIVNFVGARQFAFRASQQDDKLPTPKAKSPH